MSTIPTPSALDQLLLDIFTTALEGGINYWSSCDSYKWAWASALDHYADGRLVHEDHKGFHANIVNIVAEDDERYGMHYQINRAVMARGYSLASTTWRDKLVWSSGEKPSLVVGPETDWDYDAGDADMIVQLGLFGDVIYS